MGQYAYLINKKTKLRCESHKISGGGEDSTTIEEVDTLGRFLEYCRENKLQIECVSEHWFEQNVNLETERPYTDFA
jgi:hypothetical protein